jgi:hypothetical protein
MTTAIRQDETKPGRLTDKAWWFCKIDQHDKCAVEVELTSRFEACPCECHQTMSPPLVSNTDGKWTVFKHQRKRILDEFGCLVAETQTEARAAQIVADHAAVGKLVAALRQARNSAEVFTGGARYLDTAKTGLREIVRQIDTALAAVGEGK